MGHKLTDYFDIPNTKSSKLTREELERILKKAADLIRTHVDYKYILLLLFLKRLSDEWEKEFEEYVKKRMKEGLDRKTAEQIALQDKKSYTISYPHDYLWRDLREKDVEKLPQTLSEALKKLAELNPNLRGVVDRFDFMEFMLHRDNAEIFKQLFELFSGLDLKNASPDVLGDAYEWILTWMWLVISIPLEPSSPGLGSSIPTKSLMTSLGVCTSPSLAFWGAKYLKEKFGESEAKKLFLYGQEVNPTTYALAEMNMMIHGIKDAKLAVGDTLLRPAFKEGNAFKRFNVVIANPDGTKTAMEKEL